MKEWQTDQTACSGLSVCIFRYKSSCFSGPSCSKHNEVVSERDIRISILKYGKYTDIFCWKNVSSKSYSHFCSKNTNVFENTIATTVNVFVINELAKLTMLWTNRLRLFVIFNRSLDGILFKRKRNAHIPLWNYTVFRFQVRTSWEMFILYELWAMSTSGVALCRAKTTKVISSLYCWVLWSTYLLWLYCLVNIEVKLSRKSYNHFEAWNEEMRKKQWHSCKYYYSLSQSQSQRDSDILWDICTSTYQFWGKNKCISSNHISQMNM